MVLIRLYYSIYKKHWVCAMNKILLSISLIIMSITLNAQTHISGYIIPSDSLTDKQLVFLSTKNPTLSEELDIIASGTLDENGYFSIHQELSKEEKLYTFFTNDTNKLSRSFILSNNDSLIFQKSDTPFAVFKNTNDSDKEWQKLKKFTERQDTTINNSTIYLDEIRNYTKDSIKILAIKLLSIRELKNKNLLKKDITLNPEYYSSVLKELKLSEINASEYSFLEKELAFHHLRLIENKYSTSRFINFILGFLLFAVVIYFFSIKVTKTKKRNQELSKQELNVKKLIIEGKSNKDIAEKLFISLSTVKTHITNIYNKLNVSNRAELISKFKN